MDNNEPSLKEIIQTLIESAIEDLKRGAHQDALIVLQDLKVWASEIKED